MVRWAHRPCCPPGHLRPAPVRRDTSWPVPRCPAGRLAGGPNPRASSQHWAGTRPRPWPDWTPDPAAPRSCVKAAQSAGRSAGGHCCQPSHGGPLSAPPGGGGGAGPPGWLVPPPGRPAPGRYRAPTCGLAQRAGYLLRQAMPGRSLRSRRCAPAGRTCFPVPRGPPACLALGSSNLGPADTTTTNPVDHKHSFSRYLNPREEAGGRKGHPGPRMDTFRHRMRKCWPSGH